MAMKTADVKGNQHNMDHETFKAIRTSCFMAIYRHLPTGRPQFYIRLCCDCVRTAHCGDTQLPFVILDACMTVRALTLQAQGH